MALMFVATALSLTLILQHFESGRPTLFLFFAAIVAAAWFGGVGPGCVAAAASVPAGLYFYATALHTQAITLDDVVLFFFFLICAMVGGLFSSQQRKAETTLKRTHSQLEVKAAQLAATNEALKDEMAERRRAEQALLDTQAKLAHSGRLTALGELTASIAHEINQPLTAVVTNAGTCLRWLGPNSFDLEEAREAAARVVHDSNRASEVIKRIRAMARRAPSEHILLDVNRLVADAMSLLDREMRRHRIEVRTHFAEALPPIMGDPIQLQQVVLNVVLNAVEAMAAISDRPRILTIRSQLDPAGEIVLRIADSGVGFEGRDPDALFDAFVTSKSEGLGLGLSICRSIVEAHGGRMSAAQGSPHGADICVVLPIEVDGDE